MLAAAVLLSLVSPGQPSAAPIEPEHAANAVYKAIRAEELRLAGAKVSLPAPSHVDGASAAAEREVLSKIAGSERAVAELTRDSVSAPIVLRVRDEPVSGGAPGVIRAGDLWFVVHARLEDIDPKRADSELADGRTVEAGNMKFSTRKIPDDVLARRGIKPAAGSAEDPVTWYLHMTGRLLDRVELEATNRITATKTAESWLIASKTEPEFDDDPDSPNRWRALPREGSKEMAGHYERYPGGASYAKVSKLSTVPGALLVETHFAFFEPQAWFDGAPILRSKFGVVSQDRVRSLRRDLKKSQSKEEARTVTGSASP